MDLLSIVFTNRKFSRNKEKRIYSPECDNMSKRYRISRAKLSTKTRQRDGKSKLSRVSKRVSRISFYFRFLSRLSAFFHFTFSLFSLFSFPSLSFSLVSSFFFIHLLNFLRFFMFLFLFSPSLHSLYSVMGIYRSCRLYK